MTSGNSAYDRYANDPGRRGPRHNALDDFARPGHVFPLGPPLGRRSDAGDRPRRPSISPALRGFTPRCDLRDHERRRSHGRVPDLVRFCETHDLVMITVADLCGTGWNRSTKNRCGRSMPLCFVSKTSRASSTVNHERGKHDGSEVYKIGTCVR